MTLAEIQGGGYSSGCLLCGAELVYYDEARPMECVVCHQRFLSHAACENGHFVCDRCHAGLNPEYMPLLLGSKEKDPMLLLQQALELPGVHMHGPEHHPLLPCVLLTAYHNCGGDIDYPVAMKEAFRRGRQVPGGACGYAACCGAAIGAGIYASIVLGSNPLNEKTWAQAQNLTARVLSRIAAGGGVRCCKRTTHIAVEEAVLWTRETLGVDMPYTDLPCTFFEQNDQCMYADCPYFAMES